MITAGTQLRPLIELWFKGVANASLEGGLAFLAVYLVCCVLPRLSPQSKSWLWRLAFLRAFVALVWVQPLTLPLLPATARQTLRVQAEAVSKPLAPLLTQAAALMPDTTARQEKSLQVGPPAATKPTLSVGFFLALVAMVAWGLVVGYQLLALVWLLRRRKDFRRSLAPCALAVPNQLLARLVEQLQIKVAPQLATAPGISSPQLIGIRRPTIVLPSSMLPTLSTKDLRLVLAHELAHVVRRDLVWLWLATGVRILLFFNPLVWLAHREWLMAQEMACDELVLRTAPGARQRYSRILLALAARGPGEDQAAIGGVGMSDKMSGAFVGLRRRLESLYSSGRRRRWPGSLATAVALALTLFSLPWHLTARADGTSRLQLVGIPLGFSAVPVAAAKGAVDAADGVGGVSGSTGSRGAEGPATGWQSSGDGYEYTRDDLQLYQGQPTGRLKATIPGNFGTLSQCISAREVQGGTLNFSAVLKTQGVVAPMLYSGAGLWLRVDDGDENLLGFDNMQDRMLTGDVPWQRYTTEVAIPAAARRVCFGVFLHGQGSVWLAAVDLALSRDDEGDILPRLGAPATKLASAPQNLDFEQGVQPNGLPVYWHQQRSVPLDGPVEVSVRSDDAVSGRHSLRIRGDNAGSFARVMQCVSAQGWHGRRVELSGYLRTADIRSGRAGLWMAVQGADTQPLAYNHMHGHALAGSAGWQPYSIQLDVDGEAVDLCYGVRLRGHGTLSADALTLRDAGAAGSAPLLDNGREALRTPLNLAFEDGADAEGRPLQWRGGGMGYEVQLDAAVLHSGKASAQIRSVQPNLRDDISFGKLFQCVDAAPYRGRQLRYGGYVHTDASTTGWAGLWIRVEGPHLATLAFDNMRDQGLHGAVAWRRLATTVAIPTAAEQICYGFHLAGAGQAWADDLALTGG